MKPTVIEAVEAAYSLNTPSDEKRPFYGGSSRTEIKHVTLRSKPAFKIVVHSFGTAGIETLEIK